MFEDGEQQSNFRSNAECEIDTCNMLAKKRKKSRVQFESLALCKRDRRSSQGLSCEWIDAHFSMVDEGARDQRSLELVNLTFPLFFSFSSISQPAFPTIFTRCQGR